MRLSMGSALRSYVQPNKPQKSLPRGDRKAVVIAVAAQKGGVGKTTTSLTLGSALARFHGKRVLLIDLDPQGHINLAMRDQVQLGGGALSDVLTEPPPSVAEVEDIVTATTVGELFVTPADPELLHAEDRMASRIGKELVLKNALEITRTHYDVILIDCPPNVGTLTVNALVAADQVMIPANAAALAVAGVAGLMNTVAQVQTQLNPQLDVLGVVLTRFDKRNTRSNEAVLEVLEDNWADLVLPVHIGVNDALAQAQLAGHDIFAYDGNSRGADQYRALASCVLERLDG